MKTGVDLIDEERNRQLEVEGWTYEHDAEHKHGELACVAAAYAAAPLFKDAVRRGLQAPPPPMWPKSWLVKWWKPSPDDRIRELQKAGALIAAEIDRLQNLQK